MKKFFIAVVAISLLLFPEFSTHAQEPLQIVAYKAKEIPKVDGKIENGEWDDAQPYYFEKKTNKYILNGTFKMTVAMKHDAEDLYILAIANDDDYDDGDFVFLSFHYHPQVNISWTWETALMFYSCNKVMNGTISKSGPVPSRQIDAKINVSYHRYFQGNYYILEVKFNMEKYIPNNIYRVEVGYYDAHYKSEITQHHINPWDLSDEFYEGNFTISQSYYVGNESVEDILEQHYPTENYFWVVVLGVVAVAVVSSIIVVILRRKK